MSTLNCVACGSSIKTKSKESNVICKRCYGYILTNQVDPYKKKKKIKEK